MKQNSLITPSVLYVIIVIFFSLAYVGAFSNAAWLVYGAGLIGLLLTFIRILRGDD